MSTARRSGSRRTPKTLGDVLTAGRAALAVELGRDRPPSFERLANHVRELYEIPVVGETVRAYHQDAGGKRRNALLVAALMDLYNLSIHDLPADEAERIGAAMELLRRVSGGGTPPGTRTRNLQISHEKVRRDEVEHNGSTIPSASRAA